MAGSGIANGNELISHLTTDVNRSWWATTFAFFANLDEAQDAQDSICEKINTCVDIT